MQLSVPSSNQFQAQTKKSLALKRNHSGFLFREVFMSTHVYLLTEEQTKPLEVSAIKLKKGFSNLSRFATQTTQGWKLTSEVSEINRLSVRIQ